MEEEHANEEAREGRTCTQCGLTSRLEEAFRVRGELVGLCPRCRARRSMPWPRLVAWLGSFLLGLAVCLTVMRNLSGLVDSVLLILCGFVLFPLLLAILHEGTHALTAWLLGARVFEISLGTGGVLVSRVLRGVRWTLGASLLGGGSCLAVFADGVSRARMAAYVGAPVVLHLGLAAVLAPWVSFETRGAGLAVGMIDLLFVLNVGIALINLWPHELDRVPIPRRSDGRVLWLVATRPEFLDELRRRAPLLIGYLSHRNGDAESAERYARDLHLREPASHEDAVLAAFLLRAVQRHEDVFELARSALDRLGPAELAPEDVELLWCGWPPMNALLEFYVEDALSRTGRTDEALAYVSERLERSKAPMRFFWMNERARLLDRRGSPEELEEALALTRTMVEGMPWGTLFQGTLGELLIRNGHEEEGLAAIDRADKLGTTPELACIRHAYRALAHARLGDRDQAERHLRLARQYPVEADTVDRVEGWIRDLRREGAQAGDPAS